MSLRRKRVTVTNGQTLPKVTKSPTRRRPMAIGIVVAFTLTAVLANALAWPLVLLVYVARLRSRKSGQPAQLARDLGISISTLALKDRKRLGFFHPFW